jgi:type IV secretory pathway ATPase VirB11/archaellum biosynthesis ATPase
MKEVEGTEEADLLLLSIAQKAYINAFIKNHVEKLNAALTVLDIAQMQALLQDIRSKKIPIPQEMEEKTEMLIEESINDPQAFADRQKEALKAAKTKPKK